LRLGQAQPDPELRQVDAREFVLLKSFCYRFEARGDPDDGNALREPDETKPAAFSSALSGSLFLRGAADALGTSWRAGVDITGGWLAPTLKYGASISAPCSPRGRGERGSSGRASARTVRPSDDGRSAI
jgi:hypothetical protein